MKPTTSTIFLTLCYVFRDGKILLGMKKRGFGEGWWNGFGGKVQSGEDVTVAAMRELQEEAGLVAETWERRGVLRFYFEDQDVVREVHVFAILSYRGEPKESEEMRPSWFFPENVPFAQMWPSDRLWLPIFLQGKSFVGECLFTPQRQIVSHIVHEVTAEQTAHTTAPLA